ncbi:MAG: Gfo/Idh/MocA family oxidoreductase, partial [Phycisphaerae bacterium]|nr:Gfo/Idh/MocA family oxidoreductase [Phycisphaerae bacterium]
MSSNAAPASAATISRRRFLETSAAVAALPLIGGRVARAGSLEKLNIAVVGTQNQAAWNIAQIGSENIVALCDVDANHLARAGARIPGATRYRDFRVMLEKEKSVDAVLVAAPDHVHAPAAAMALRQGRHVYCEKPLAHTVEETRTLARLAAEQGVATQMGTQIHAGANYRRVVELIRSGAIGPVREAHVWCGKSWSNGRFRSAPVPDHLDWDLWQGPAPARPYSAGVHPGNWRRFWDYGTGTLGDMGCHYIDLVFWALALRHPTAVQTFGPAVHEVGTPRSLLVEWSFPARGKQPPVTMRWYDGGLRPSILSALRNADGSPFQWGDGQLFVGDKGMLIADYGRYRLLPEHVFEGFQPPPPSIADSVGH